MQIRRKNFLALSGVAASVTLLAACGGDSDTDGGTGGGASDAGGASDGGGETAEGVPARGNADLVIWADELKAKSLQEPAKTWADAQGITVEVQTVANDLQTNYVTANQAGNGPDIVLGAHD
ncbi:hypothetical protein M3G50_10815 [Brachybacterium muris]|nr:hypothetical protein [Brachybacterium muris]MCT1431239.1 hypothetical protein [Brachybacterium muris]